MKFTLNTSHIDDVEHRISPPMAKVITLPIIDEAIADRGLSIYIAQSAFNATAISDTNMIALAHIIADKLQK